MNGSRMPKWKLVILAFRLLSPATVILTLACILALAPALQARTCGGNGDVIGPFGWLGSRSAEFVPDPIVTATAPIAGSATPIGGLAAGAANIFAFASVGRLFLDGNGGLFAASRPGGPVVPTGAYNVNSDCTISVTILDTFPAPVIPGTIQVPAMAMFEGVVVGGGNEVDLTQTGTASGTILTLKKTAQSCTINSLFSAFGITATGVGPAPTTITTPPPDSTTTSDAAPFTILGRFVADGAGNLVEDATALQSPLVNREVTGTYSVNSDCTGTALLVTADGQRRNANLVIVNVGSDLAIGPQVEFAFSDPGVVGSGSAQQQ